MLRVFIPPMLDPFTNDFPRADIHELITPDILHQLIKGTFKDHLVDWVVEYLASKHGKARSDAILAQIDRRIGAVPLFTGLRRFPEGHGFKQWTGDDSKALMKVYLPAIDGLIPRDMVRAIRAFLDFCYLARRDVHTPTSLAQLQEALGRFHRYRAAFRDAGIHIDSLPRQHSLDHYFLAIMDFGALNGICSSITESKHIKAVKEPYRLSNRFKPLRQMLLTNQRRDKLAACRVDFESRGLLPKSSKEPKKPPKKPPPIHLEDGSVDGPRVADYVMLATRSRRQHHHQPVSLPDGSPRMTFHHLLQLFLQDRLKSSHMLYGLRELPDFDGVISIHYSAAATFYAPSDPSGIGGMHREHIRANPCWRGTGGRFDCVLIKPLLVEDDSPRPPWEVARVFELFSFQHLGEQYQCALVHWFDWVGDSPDEDTGMWVIHKRRDQDDSLAIISVDRILRAAHLIPVFGEREVNLDITETNSLDSYRLFYLNKYADHHAFELLHSG
ncbi:hypothetical protein OE88DRAFT_1735362 [Heliocybe sulcata]|uniref:Fungal-type protein kinase domain-containing protein n=1 Tax=Heliocybe sulcata TaxID=5364 RepID=A0A5C3N4U1_9AGAM|nr:hypothetical protein OE88DRAFT_1735362 [Heliocybe sulcata]